MARPTTRERSAVSEAVVALRTELGETQEQFAKRLDTVLGTVARYETSRPPSGAVLGQLMNLSYASKRNELGEVFREALAKEVGVEIDPPWASLRKVILGLPPEWKTLLHLHFSEELSVDEAASKLKMERVEVDRMLNAIRHFVKEEIKKSERQEKRILEPEGTGE